MGIINYFRRLKEYFTYRKRTDKERDKRFYEKCKEGIFSFFDSYKTRNGFYFELKDKENLINYLHKDKTIESKVLTTPLLPQITEQEYVEKHNNPIYEAFERVIEYFKKIKKESLDNYSGLDFNYNYNTEGVKTGNKNGMLEVKFE